MKSWGDFLKVRAQCIREMRAEGKTCTEVARVLSLDGPGQVWLINADHEPDPPPEEVRVDVVEGIIKGRPAMMVAWDESVARRTARKPTP